MAEGRFAYRVEQRLCSLLGGSSWIFFKVDRAKTNFTDLEESAAALFPFSAKRQEAFFTVEKAFLTARKPLYLRDLVERLHRQLVQLSTTINMVWKATLRGVWSLGFGEGPASLSSTFSSRVEEAAAYWQNYLQSHAVTQPTKRR